MEMYNLQCFYQCSMLIFLFLFLNSVRSALPQREEDMHHTLSVKSSSDSAIMMSLKLQAERESDSSGGRTAGINLDELFLAPSFDLPLKDI